MSHFAVIVVTDEEPTNAVLTKVLQPWHEFECTGADDQYVVDVDETDSARSEYEKATQRLYIDPHGTEFNCYDDRFYREMTEEEKTKIGSFAGTGCGHGMSWTSKDWGDGRGYRTKVHFLPEGYRDETVPTRESFAEFASSYYGSPIIKKGETRGKDSDGDERDTKYGYVLVDDAGEVLKVIDRTNPNKQWDWWVVGGRYGSRLIRKGGQVCDSSRFGDIDFDAMKRARQAETRGYLDKAVAKGVEKGIDLLASWRGLCEVYPSVVAQWEEAGKPRRLWDWADEKSLFSTAMREAATIMNWEVGISDPAPEAADMDAYIESRPSLSTWAVVKDGEWIEKGEMGWWGVSFNEVDDWQAQLQSILDSIREDQHVTIVDCHI